MAKLVSILIPAYNAENLLSDTILSALNQTWPSKEIIIVDDGSSDGTLRIARTFEKASVRVITQENRGASAARNIALSLAEGDYIQWLDADDLLAPDKISQQLKLEAGNDRILYSSSYGEFYFRHEKAKFVSNSLWRDLSPTEWLLTKFKENIWMHPAAWLVSRKLTDLAGPWDERLTFDDDGEYFCRVVSNSSKVQFVADAKSYYRIGNIGSLSWGMSEKASESIFLSISQCIDHLRSLEDSEKTRAACLKFLHNKLLFFYPDKQEILIKINNLADVLGGTISCPPESRKFSVVRRIAGWKLAKKIKNTAWKAEILTRKKFDELLHLVSKKTPG